MISLMSDVCLYVAYIGPKWRTERPRETKIGTEVAHVTRDSDTTFKGKRSKVKVKGAGHIVATSRTACCSIQFIKMWPSVKHFASIATCDCL